MYHFDESPALRDTNRLKFKTPPAGAPQDTIPMWVADMDFAGPPEMLEAIQARVMQGGFGYTYLPPSYHQAVTGWMQRRHNWQVDPSWIVVSPGVIPALKTAVEAFTKPGEAVLVQMPVYYMFMNVIELMGRTVVDNPLTESPDGYRIDLEDFEKKIIEQNVKLFFLCNPHNPVSRVWTKEELTAMGNICKKHGVLVVSDEIHHDFVFPGYRYTPFVEADPSFAEISVTCTAPSKTFNCAGLKVSHIIIPNESLREQYNTIAKRFGQTGVHALSIPAVEAVYNRCDQWVDEMLAYVKENFDILDRFCKDEIPQLRLQNPECLYLAWIDVRGLNMTDEEFYQLALEAGVWIEAGREFGEVGKGYVRMNLACPHETVLEALARIKKKLTERS